VYAVLDGQWAKIGYLEEGWRVRDLVPFEGRLAELRGRHEAGEAWQPQRRLGLAEYAEQWFAELYTQAEAGRISKLTYNTYEGVWANHLEPAFGHVALDGIDAAAIRRYVNGKLAGERCSCGGGCERCAGSGWNARPLAPVSVNATLTPLSAMLTDAVADGLIASNPARQPRRARHGGSRRTQLLADARRGAPKFLELHEARALLTATPTEHRAMVLAALTTGARRGELLALRWENIDWAGRRVEISGQLQKRRLESCKYDSERQVVLYSGLAGALGPRRRAEGFVFTAPDGRPWASSGPERAFLADAYATAGLRRPGQLWHVLRHTYASVLAAGGVRRDVVERLMGHAGKGTTSLYTHLFADAMEGVEEALHAAFGVNQTSTECSGSTVPDPLAQDGQEIAVGRAVGTARERRRAAGSGSFDGQDMSGQVEHARATGRRYYI
jgi:integrase